MICLDTNVVIGLINKRSAGLLSRFRAEQELGTRVIMPTMVLHELRYGIAKSVHMERNNAVLDRFLATPIEVAVFDRTDANDAGVLRAYLDRAGTPIGPYDLLIAAQTRRLEAVLITANRREFDRVPGLMVQDWST